MEDLNEPFNPDCSTDNNLYISADDFFKILDEEVPDEESPQEFDLSGTLEGFDQGQLAAGQIECEDVFHPQSGMVGPLPVMEDCWKTGTFQRNSSDYTDSSDYYSDGWLGLSTSKDNTLMDSVAGSPNNLVPGTFDCQEFDNNIQPCGASNGSVEMAGFLYPTNSDLVNGLYLNSKQENEFVKMGGENSFPGGSEEPMADDMNISSLFMPQDGRRGESVLTADSSHDMLMQTSYCGGLMHFDINTTTMPGSSVLGGNIFSPLSSSQLPPNVMLPDTIYTEMNNSETTDVTGNVSDTCLTFRRHSASDVEIASTKVLHGQSFQSSLFREKGSMLYRNNQEVQQLHNSGMTSKVTLGTPKESPSTAALPVVSIIDLDEPSPSALCAGNNYWEDTRFNNESSTDSSPVPSSRYSTSDNVCMAVVNTAKRPMPSVKITLPNKKQKIWSKDKAEDWTHAARQKQHEIPTNNDTFQRNYSKSILSVDDDADICVLDDISDPVRPPVPPDHLKLHSRLQRSECTDTYYHGPGVTRVNTYDERPTIHLALQDLSEPKSESSPPDGVLAVSLLRHQKIALSWMVQRETINRHCTGGILADDQGLGKTISTLALILTERSPPSKNCLMTPKPEQLEALNVDDDDDDDGSGSDMKVIEQLHNSSTVMTGRPIKRENPVIVVKGRPAAGTLVVCPTSVLRQWADEIQNKVTSKANLSFLVYYGSNRTKDPNELAKYDVVITTYAIVSMEVPKQPLVDKDDEVKASGPQSGLSTSKKKKSSLNSKNQDSAMLESAARPLARVGWFRVILDEAQSIKNYRTQVARACWGLRAKRRWCLSGTPIQNAVDDLYSYFRFLRYAPFDVYKSFCSSIKMPISRNPTPGYRKLQILLQTIMLRRTKGTLLDGKPIINLPPKTVTLKKVDFSEEERSFYSTLEIESQEQYKEYAAAGTVKQNYVNILLLLLRLRQACDHPLLVKTYGSNSIGRASMDMVKKLSRDKQINLLSCLEACLAICTICKDPPEDAVVTICGHVFCNQCICEHLTGDDNICPSAQCKVRLTAASVFSKDTIKSCLSGQPELDCSSSSSVPHVENTLEKSDSGSLTSDSSKIKAALEILLALPLCSSRSKLKSSVINSVDTVSLSCSVDIDRKYLGSSKSSNDQAMEKSIVLSTDRKYLGSSKSSDDRATEKAIVFSQWTRMLDLFEVPLKDSGIQYRRLDGTMSVVARDKAVKDFNTLPEVTVMIMSLKAASLGLNMIAACHVILLDLWWNPTTEDQAIDRAHRIGQTRPVSVSRLTVRDTVEDRILGLQEKKRKMVASAFGEDEAGSRQSRLSVDDLNFLFMGQGQ